LTKTKRPLPVLLFGKDREVALWVAERVPDIVNCFNEKSRAIGVVSGNRLIAGVVYSDYHEKQSTMQLSIASSSPMWARTETIRALLSYPFKQLGIFKCWIATPDSNEKSLRLTDHIGFKREATLAHHFGQGKHAIISRMFKPSFVGIYGG
jgi:RimJ/RimL family protein N-acetyltransferase